MENKKGSILAYALIIIATMLAIASSLSVTSVIEKKSASGTEFSMQSFQTSDGGAQLALKKINAELVSPSSATILSLMPSCVGGKVIGSDAGPSGSSYELTFLDEVEALLSCNDNVDKIAKIHSVGTYRDTVRVVDVSVEAGPESDWLAGPSSASGAGCQALLDVIKVYDPPMGAAIWKDTETWCNTSPATGQCALVATAANNYLVDPQTYPSVDFSTYEAQNVCKTIGGRLARRNELSCIYANRAHYEKDYLSGGVFWSADEASGTRAWALDNGIMNNMSKNYDPWGVLCVKNG